MIIHFTSEVAPFYKRGGLGDVVGALPKYLSESTHNVVISFYYEKRMMIENIDFKESFKIEIQNIEYEFDYYYLNQDNVDYYFLNMSDELIFSDLESSESDLLGESGDRPYDNKSSYIVYLYFAKAALQLIYNLKLLPDFLLFHDWHACGCFAFSKLMNEIYSRKRYSTILIIHNYEYQGDIFPDTLEFLNEEESAEIKEIFREYKTASLLSIGLKNADYVGTVSKNYGKELLTGNLPHKGLAYLKSIKKKKIFALPNGIDQTIWSPEKSPYIPGTYNKSSVNIMKAKAKEILLKRAGFVDSSDPVILLMSRLTDQKGIGIIINSWDTEETSLEKFEALLNTGIKLIVCGRPGGGLNGNINKRFALAQKKFPHKFCYIPTYNEPDAHLFLAGSDAILCPSLFEPCGLVHLYGMSFGTVPVVRPVGGLRDTVISHNEYPEISTGFYIDEFNFKSLIEALRKTVHTYKFQNDIWQKIMLRCMEEDYSWEKARHNYLQLFDSIKKEYHTDDLETINNDRDGMF
ncbi:glycogen/starch synthase [Flavobacterium sp. UGB4466]|uniref:glycogen/starch synthase n=1 Tax=Flavobacterium sp. UGB4466 TaxID=2730889 RepID=UPI00192BC81C|nr:glycogen/starch synthase [Flavobacterium sp. UGB4466]